MAGTIEMVTKKRRTYSEADKTRFAEQRRAQLEAMQAQITQQTTELVQGDQWQEWLRFSGRFHSYSFFNVMLILLQKPDASLVAGYRAWQAKGRQVQKGETGVRIMAPVLARADVLDKAGNPVLDENGKPKKSNRIVNVKPATVFDVSQTCGEPIPERPHPQLLKGQAPEGLWESLATLIGDCGYQVQRADCGAANGITDFVDRTVTVRPDLDDAQATKTLIHEAGHVLLHEPDCPDLRDSTGLCRGEKEVEAESVAFLVANAHGLDTSDYTFAYVASWASNALQQAEEGTTLAEIIAKTGQRVVKAAHTILDATQPEQTLDETNTELAAEAAAQIAEDRQLGKPTMAVPVANADQINAVLADSRQPAQALARAQRDTGIVLQDEAPAVAPTRRQIREVFEQYDSARFDTFSLALDAAQQITSFGVIGAVHSVRTYDPNSVVDGEVDYLTEAHETVVFENQRELDRWAGINGLHVVEGRNDDDNMTSIDSYQHPFEGYIEMHELCVQRPAAAVAPEPVLEDRDLGRQLIQDALFAAFPSAASASMQPTAATPVARTSAAARTAAPAMDR